MTIDLNRVHEIAHTCSTTSSAVAHHLAASAASDRAGNPKHTRPGSPAVGYAHDEAARHWLSALLATPIDPATTAAERLLAAGIMAARAQGDELELDVPAIAELLAAGDGLAELLEGALETHIYEPDEVPPTAPELGALSAWELAKRRAPAGAAAPIGELLTETLGDPFKAEGRDLTLEQELELAEERIDARRIYGG